MDTETNTTATATHTALAAYQHALVHLTVSFSVATATALTLLIKDGTTVIWQVELAIGVFTFTENFETRPLHASVNADLVATVGAAGSGVVGTISMAGFSVKQA